MPLTDELTLGKVRVKVEFDTSGMERQARGELKRTSERIGNELGEATGKNAAKSILQRLNLSFRQDVGDAKEALASGLIDPAEFERRGRAAAQKFNKQVLGEIKRLGQQAEVPHAEITKLQNSLKRVGTSAEEGANKATSAFLSLRRAASALITVFIGFRAIRGVVNILAEQTKAGIELAQSYLRLNASAKLFGVSQNFLVELSQRAHSQFKLTTKEANELAVQTTKLASGAGDAGQSWELLSAALDLGAAQGFTANEVALALEQTLRGLDEGTDKLLQRNPAQVYKEYAASIGKGASSLSAMEQKQALVNAVLTQGAKVAGAYDEVLKTDVGTLQAFGRELTSLKQSIGTALIPVMADFARIVSGPLQKAVDGLIWRLQSIEILGVNAAVALKKLQVAVLEAATKNETPLQRLANVTERALRGLLDPDAPSPATRLREARKELENLEAAATDEVLRILGMLPPKQGGGAPSPTVAVTSADVEALEKTADKLREIARIQKELADQAEGFGVAITGLPDEVVQQIEQVVRIENEIVETEKNLAKAKGLLSPEQVLLVRDHIALLNEQLVLLRQRIAEMLPNLKDAFDPNRLKPFAPTLLLIRGHVETLSTALGNMRRASEAVANAENELAQARRTADPERTERAEAALAKARADLVLRTSALAKAVEDSNLPLEQQKELIERIDETLKAAGIDMSKFGEEASKLQDYAEFAAVLARGLLSVADALGLISQDARRAFAGLLDVLQGLQAIDKAKTKEGFARTLALAGGGVAIAGGAAALLGPSISSFFGGLFGGGDSEAQRQARELAQRNTAALERATKAIEEWGTRIAGLSAQQVNDFRDVLSFLNTGLSRSGSAGISTSTLQNVAEFFGIQLGPNSSISKELAEKFANLIEQALDAAFQHVQDEVIPDFQSRALKLAGKDVEAAQVLRIAAAQKEKRELENLAAAGFLTTEQLSQFTEIIDQELVKALEDAEAAASRAAREEELRARQLEADVTAREARLAGRSLEATQDELRAQADAQLAAANEMFIAGEISEDLFNRLTAVIEGELNQALEQAAEAARRTARDFDANLAIREAALRGDTLAELRARLELQNAQELEQAKDMLDQGRITEDLFNRLANVLAGELNKSLEDAAAAAAKLSKELDDNLELRELEARGETKLAALRRQELEQQQEIADFIAKGATSDQLARLRRVQALERQNLLQSFLETPSPEDVSASALTPVRDVVRASVTGITTTQAFRLVDINLAMLRVQRTQLEVWRHALVALQLIEAHTRRSGVSAQPGSSALGVASLGDSFASYERRTTGSMVIR